MSKERIIAYIEKLHSVTKYIEEKLQNDKYGDKNVRKMTGKDFENIVYDSLIEMGFKKEEISHSPQKFPDFILEDLSDGDKIGVEVKKTDAAKWEVIGGSIYESLKNDIKDTYILMAKLGGVKPEVRLKRYEECIDDLKVTHSPRFYLNLELKEGEDYLTRNEAKDLLEKNVDESYYLSQEKIDQISHWKSFQNPLDNVLGQESVCPTITTRIAESNRGGINASMKVVSQELENTTNLLIKNATKQGYLEATVGDGIDISSRMESHRGTVQKDMAQTITTMGGENLGVVVNE